MSIFCVTALNKRICKLYPSSDEVITHIDFLPKGMTINLVQYCKTLWALKQRLHRISTWKENFFASCLSAMQICFVVSKQCNKKRRKNWCLLHTLSLAPADLVGPKIKSSIKTSDGTIPIFYRFQYDSPYCSKFPISVPTMIKNHCFHALYLVWET